MHDSQQSIICWHRHCNILPRLRSCQSWFKKMNSADSETMDLPGEVETKLLHKTVNNVIDSSVTSVITTSHVISESRLRNCDVIQVPLTPRDWTEIPSDITLNYYIGPTYAYTSGRLPKQWPKEDSYSLTPGLFVYVITWRIFCLYVLREFRLYSLSVAAVHRCGTPSLSHSHNSTRPFTLCELK